ncbi:pentapeptide repeat protein, partial [Hungatella hathewayi DSM 13479]
IPETNGAGPLRYLGYHFQGADLSAMDFSSSFLIAADLKGCRLFGTCFLGTDLRDADLRGTDLREAFFLTQMQINAAKGSRDTRLPSWLKMPDHWNSA